MFNFDVSISIVSLLAIVAGATVIGYLVKNGQLKKKQRKIQDLRTEIVFNHSYILELQQEYVALEEKMKGNMAPVLPIKRTLAERPKTAEGKGH